MDRQQRRQADREARKAPDRAEILRLAMAALADAANTATGATLIFPDGTSVYLDAETARDMHRPPAGRGDA